MIFTFYKALGYDIRKSFVEEDIVDLAGDLMKKAEEKGVKFVLPTNVVLVDEFDNDATIAVAKANDILGDWMRLDIGLEMLNMFAEEVKKSNTIVFNGPMGVFELGNFATGTVMVTELMAKATERGKKTIVGDDVAAANQAGLGDKVHHISKGVDHV